tara:strand:+ start:3913 stop:5229 length:1317 start_codon:yes stop_codon:yes gene_type:complete
MKKHIENLIIGAGISGLATGHFLKKQKKEFFIFESNDSVGGVINTQKIKNLICENGPNTVLLNNNAIIELIDDLDLSTKIIQPTKYVKNKFFLHKGKIVKLPNNLKSFLSTKLISIKSKIKILKRLFFFNQEKYETVYKYVSENFGEDVHDNIFEPFLNGIYAGNTKKMSFEHALPKLWKINSIYNGFIDYFFKKNKKKKNNNPIYFKDGFATLINELKISLKDEIYTKFKVKKVRKLNDEKYLIEFLNSKKITCNKIIFTISPKNIIEIMNLKIVSFDKKLYNPIDVIHFAFNKKDYQRKIKGFGLLSKKSENTSFLGILFNSDIFPNVAPNELKLITVLVGGENQSDLCKLDKNKITSIVESEIKELLKIKKIVFKKHFRWEQAIPRYNVQNIKFLSSNLNNHLISFKNIYLNGNYLNGISVSDCILKSKRISKKI